MPPKQHALELKAWLESDDSRASRKAPGIDIRSTCGDRRGLDDSRSPSSRSRPHLRSSKTGARAGGDGPEFLEMVKKVLANGRLIVRDRAVTLFIVQYSPTIRRSPRSTNYGVEDSFIQNIDHIAVPIICNKCSIIQLVYCEDVQEDSGEQRQMGTHEFAHAEVEDKCSNCGTNEVTIELDVYANGADFSDYSVTGCKIARIYDSPSC